MNTQDLHSRLWYGVIGRFFYHVFVDETIVTKLGSHHRKLQVTDARHLTGEVLERLSCKKPSRQSIVRGRTMMRECEGFGCHDEMPVNPDRPGVSSLSLGSARRTG